ncbi:odorant receptor 65a-like [Drosophila bipectinata]|uniref:odorant receptor 65a-like n=1 Tax=Drosophila bipectinata TaxID=42026 RepID=UPI001C88E270|nr:odorant receptor 65a-like [Drosophila bipectinata]
MKAIGFYMNTDKGRQPLLVAWHYFFMLQMAISLASLGYGILESLDDIVLLGQDLAYTIGTFYIFFKMVHFSIHADDIDEIIDGLEECYQCDSQGRGLEESRCMKRRIFFWLTGLNAAWLFMVISFVLIIISTPFWLEAQELPFHVAYPFHLHDPSQHPLCHATIFVSQSCILMYAMIWTLCCEHISVTIFSELTSALKVLCTELRVVHERCDGNSSLFAHEVYDLAKFHQRIICLTDRSNEIFNGAFTMQLIVNFLLISLSVFEAMVSRHDPKVAAEYLVLMVMALGHLSYWSKFGDMLTQESLNVAVAAYEAYDPTYGFRSTHTIIWLIIQRAQTPLSVKSRLFPPFNLENNLAVN